MASLSQPIATRWHLALRACKVVAACVALSLLAGCPSVPRTGQLEMPAYSLLEIPNTSGGWTSYSSSPPMEILPTRGRAVRVWFYAPVGSSFGVSLRAPDGTLTTLPQNFGANPAPEDGFFQVISVNSALNPPLYTVYVRAPLALMDPANFDILVVNQSLRTNVTDSNPMVVRLAQRKVFTVSVQVNGNGHVTSNPPGIECGTSPSGRALTNCSYEFGPGQVSLNPGSNDLTTTKFLAWSGNCPPGVQVCQFTLNGMAAVIATATFGPTTSTATVSACPVPPLLAGLRWLDTPSCATNNLAGHPGISLACDAAGYFCCEPGGPNNNAPRCGGTQKIETLPDCRHRAPKGTLRQPGGCYEVDSFP